MTLTKADIVVSIKRQFGFTRRQPVETVETLLEIMKKTLESGEDILIILAITLYFASYVFAFRTKTI